MVTKVAADVFEEVVDEQTLIRNLHHCWVQSCEAPGPTLRSETVVTTESSQ